MEISRFLLDRSETEGIEPLGVFAAAAEADFRCFWSSPEERRTLVGVGIAAEWVGDGGPKLFEEATDFVRKLDFDGDMPVLLGGFAFRCSADAYRSFGDAPSDDGVFGDGLSADGLSPDGLSADGLSAGGLLTNRLSADGLRVAQSMETPLSDYGSVWGGFPSGRLVLPEVLLSFPAADAGETEEAAVVLTGRKSERLLRELLSKARELSEMNAANPATSDLETADIETSSFADQEPSGNETSGRKQADQETSAADFRRLLREAVEAVGSGELEKVVVARQVRHGRCPAPEDVLRRLCERGGRSTVFAFSSAGDSSTPDSSTPAAGRNTVFAFSSAGGADSGASSGATKSVFAGASPELLAAKSGKCFTSLALAGSKPLHEADLLLNDAKELAEHQYVVDHLRSRLANTEAELAATGPPEVLCLANIAHLASSVSGKTSDSILDLVETLHPSPAVAGVPTDAALEFLRQHEQFDRGWYAGPVGWLTPDGDGRFFVALRSVLLNPDESLLFAGSGIVEGSCPEKEEQETWLKLQTALEALLPSSLASSPSPVRSSSPATSPPLANSLSPSNSPAPASLPSPANSLSPASSPSLASLPSPASSPPLAV